MPALNLVELMTLYAKLGIADWIKTSSDIKNRANRCLGNRIAENIGAAAQTLSKPFSQNGAGSFLFIPMPNLPQRIPSGGVECSFFCPMQEWVDGERVARVSFDLFMLVTDMKCLAFRLEPGHVGDSSHDYCHLQFNRRMLAKNMGAETRPWMPDSYPAFPTRTKDPIELFLFMATSVHGHTNGMRAVLREIFTQGNRASEAASYLAILDMMFN
jgi:hypothetical protein